MNFYNFCDLHVFKKTEHPALPEPEDPAHPVMRRIVLVSGGIDAEERSPSHRHRAE